MWEHSSALVRAFGAPGGGVGPALVRASGAPDGALARTCARRASYNHAFPTRASNGSGTRRSDAGQDRARAYWRANLKLSAVLLTIWFLVSFGFGIILVEPLNRIPLFGFKLGFWWAQQGSIYVFIVLIFVYAAAMNGSTANTTSTRTPSRGD